MKVQLNISINENVHKAIIKDVGKRMLETEKLIKVSSVASELFNYYISKHYKLPETPDIVLNAHSQTKTNTEPVIKQEEQKPVEEKDPVSDVINFDGLNF